MNRVASAARLRQMAPALGQERDWLDMEETRREPVARLLSGLGSRRMALSAAAVSGLALASQAAAAKSDVSSEGKKRRRRGKRGKQGPSGPSGPPAGAGAVLEKTTCTFSPDDAGDVGASEGCQVPCPSGTVAVGGGFEGPTFIDSIGHVISSYPTQTGQNPPDGWETTIEFLDFGQQFDVTTYVICLPA